MRTALVLLILLLATPALANDGVVNELGTGIAPLNATEVRLEREVVVFTEVGRRWAVTADLHFRNPGKTAQTLKLGFPADYEIESDGDPFLADLAVWVDGQPAKLELVPVSGSLAGEGPPWSRMYTFEATFPPGADVQVLHQYTVEPSGDSMAYDYLTYVFRTGASWGGTVGEARFVFRFDRPPIAPRLTVGSQFVAGAPWDGKATAHLDSVRCAVPGAKGCHYEYVAGPTATLSLILSDVEPAGDIHVQWGGIDKVQSLEGQGDDAMMCGYYLFTFDSSLGQGADWPDLNEDIKGCFDPAVLRNLMFAARGFVHTSDRYKTMFKDLYLPSDAPFDASWMSGRESWTIEQLKELEAQKK